MMDEKTRQACEWNTAHEEQCDLREAIVELSSHEWAIHSLLNSFAAAVLKQAEEFKKLEELGVHSEMEAMRIAYLAEKELGRKADKR